MSHDVKLKCNSLPAGALPPTSGSFRLSRSKSNAGKSQDDASLRGGEREEKLSLFERLFPRRSGKKKKKDEMRDRDEKIVKEEKMAKMEVDGDTRTSVNEEKKVRYCGTQYLYHSVLQLHFLYRQIILRLCKFIQRLLSYTWKPKQ